ncbi:MAG: PEP-CTERM sorting domain-containing protein [Planctomycetes bacterium]|nr:PEP-CTERM sorting domain-containing protein [Planctomycetota bacterium]
MVSLGDFPGNQRNSGAYGVSADGSVVVGFGSSERSRLIEGFRWTAETGLIPLGSVNPAHIYSVASDVSADGRVVAGSSYNGTGFRWTQAEGMVPIGEWSTNAYAISADGSTIVGTHGANGTMAYRWTAETGIVSLGRPAEFIDSYGVDVSGDGSIVVGRGSGTFTNRSYALIWDEAHGNRVLEDVLTGEYGLDLGGYQLWDAVGVSADGRSFVGSGYGPDETYITYIATIPEPTTAGMLLLLVAGWRRASR